MAKKYVLPNMEHRFQIQVVGEESGINWVGDFMYRRPTLAERSLIDVMRTRLSGDLRNIDGDVAALNDAISHLRFTLKEFPEWWSAADFGGSLYDANVIVEIYNKCIEFEARWRNKVQGGNAEKVEAGKANEEDQATQ